MSVQKRVRLAALAVGVLAVPVGLIGGMAGTASANAASVHSCTYRSTVGYTCDYYYYNATISEWSSNAAAVKEIQDIINSHTDYPIWLTVDGSFGPNTLTAVKWLQSHHNIAGGADGIVGPNTWAYLRA
ncbi:peptidoglycan-binding domain-containing protein [Streptomyces sp. NPDC005708]|uniref:peptidoglycan-binding domain-containing protein n=1 Tax=unclassified Streptomyces TaxID=2593676 RepID=UPI0033D016A8